MVPQYDQSLAQLVTGRGNTGMEVVGFEPYVLPGEPLPLNVSFQLLDKRLGRQRRIGAAESGLLYVSYGNSSLALD